MSNKEEPKELSAVFFHDIRTQITVLKGYTDLLGKYIPEGKISEQKVLDILETMHGQIERLENYTQKMSTMQRLEDIELNKTEVTWSDFVAKCTGISNVLKGSLNLEYVEISDQEVLCFDEELALEVYENLITNAIRYATQNIKVGMYVSGTEFRLIVEDDGKGFSDTDLQNACSPFYRDRKGGKEHLGLGLYICRVICEKNAGQFLIENGKSGAKVTAIFKNLEKCRKN